MRYAPAAQAHIRYQRRPLLAVPAMTLRNLLLALAIAHLQRSLGQHINEGNNLIAVASHKLATIKQQSQIQNVTDAAEESDSEQNINLSDDKYLEEIYTNNSVLYPSGGGITSIKFVKHPAYDGPLPSFSIINNKKAADSTPGTHNLETVTYTVPSAVPKDAQSSVPLNQIATKQTEHKSGFISKSPLFISFAPRSPDAAPPQAAYFVSALPTQSSLPNMVTLQPSPSPSPNHQSHQTFSSVQYQPSNVQSPTNMRLRFVPAQSMQNTGPILNSTPIHNTMPIHNTIPMQSSIPTQGSIPIQNTVPIQNALPIQNSVPLQNTVPIQNTLSIQKTIDACNTIHNPQLPYLLSHILSQNPAKQDSAPTIIRCQSQDPKPSKQTAVQTLLPLILQLLTEKNNNCCEYKKIRPCTSSRHKQGRKHYVKLCPNSLELAKMSDAADHFHRINQNKRLIQKPYEDSLDEEDYSSEGSDYTAEDYYDED